MPRNKLKKLEALHSLPHVYEEGQTDLLEKIHSFIENKSVTLELGCGRGEYTLALAKLFPNELFIGIDLQGERIWHGVQAVIENKLTNVLFLRLPIANITDLFPSHSIKSIWLPFSDPFPRNGDARKRLTATRFLDMYKKLLIPHGMINIKTDSLSFFEYSIEQIANHNGKILTLINNIPMNNSNNPLLNITTNFERKHRAKGRKIHYLQAEL